MFDMKGGSTVSQFGGDIPHKVTKYQLFLSSHLAFECSLLLLCFGILALLEQSSIAVGAIHL